MGNSFFETVAVAQQRARRRLPKSVYKAVLAGSESGRTIEDNVAAFREIGFAPHVAELHGQRDLTTTVMGQQISLPVITSPAGVQAVNPEAELDVGRATAARGTAIGLSSFGSKPIEEVLAVNPRTFLQLYWLGGRGQLEQRVARAKAAGAAGLIVTLDWSFSYGRDWGSPSIPERIDLKAALKMVPEVVIRPGWLLQWAKSGQLPDLSVPNLADASGHAPTFFEAYGQWLQTEPPTWNDLRWLREQWDGPFMLKGIMRPDDARRAVDAGFSAISVSNHGGNNLDTTPASIRALPTIAEAVGHEIEVLLDGGIRRGSDVVKAVALGARAVMIGRAYLWGLAANGQAGVENVLDVLRSGIDSALLGLGHASLAELSPSDLLIPPGFDHGLATAGKLGLRNVLNDVTAGVG
ncbi:MAG: pre-mycofactocin synthase MftD [Solirubrobacteraceae bacterium]